MKEIKFEKARISEVKHNLSKVTAGTVPSAIKIVALMTSEIAQQIGYRWLLFDREKDVKNGYAEVVLDLELNNLRVKFEAPKIDGLDLYVDRVSKVKVYTKAVKKAKKLMVSFLAHHHGSPFQMLEYLIKVGGIEGTCTLIPRQEELPFAGTAADATSLVSNYEAGGWSARIEVKEMPGGSFAVTRRAQSPTKKLAQGPAEEFASEADARQAGAIAVQQWADKIRAGAKGKDKAEAAKLSDWCSTFINPQIGIASATATEAVQ